jgi:glycosyltransferase involved in cell wall biosynthesis
MTGQTAANGITVILPCCNEAENIRACLESAAWADEILVVDSGSTDDTLKIAREFTDRILQREYVNPASQRNWAIPQARHSWVLIIDADERVTPELGEEIRRIISSADSCSGYFIRRRNFFAGKEIRHCGWQRDWVVRLFRRDEGRYDDSRPHNYHAGVKVAGKTGRCRGVMDHHPYRDLKTYLEKLRRYSDWGGLDAAQQGERASFWRLLFHPMGRFLRMYVLQRGFLDGMHGLVICLLAACYTALQDVRLWEIQGSKESQS